MMDRFHWLACIMQIHEKPAKMLLGRWLDDKKGSLASGSHGSARIYTVSKLFVVSHFRPFPLCWLSLLHPRSYAVDSSDILGESVCAFFHCLVSVAIFAFCAQPRPLKADFHALLFCAMCECGNCVCRLIETRYVNLYSCLLFYLYLFLLVWRKSLTVVFN